MGFSIRPKGGTEHQFIFNSVTIFQFTWSTPRGFRSSEWVYAVRNLYFRNILTKYFPSYLLLWVRVTQGMVQSLPRCGSYILQFLGILLKKINIHLLPSSHLYLCYLYDIYIMHSLLGQIVFPATGPMSTFLSSFPSIIFL